MANVYSNHKDGIAKLLVTKGFNESKSQFTFDEESDQSFDKKFIIIRPEINTEGDGAEYLQDRLRPRFSYKVILGFKLTQNKGTFDYEVAQNLIDSILAYLNNPANYTDFCIKLHVISVSEEKVDNHLESTLSIDIIDDLLLA